MKRQYIFGHTSPETAYLVEDYPYGFRLRTQIRYWIETTKNGDRFCSQTKNPKVSYELWNKPKKSTYSAVGVMFLDENNHVKWTGFSLGWTKEDKIMAFVDEIGGKDKLSEAQLDKVKEGIAISRTQDHITYECVNVTGQSEEERAKHKAEQAEIEKNIGKLYAYNRATVEV